jgi:hypothetical protein
MVTNQSDNNDILYVIASVLHQTYHHIKHLKGNKQGYHVINPEDLLKKSPKIIEFFNKNQEAEKLFYDELRILPGNDLSSPFDIIQLKIKSHEPSKPSAVYCFCPNPYVRDLTRQLYNLFICASELLTDSEPQKIIEIMAHHYCYAFQKYLTSPIGTFDGNTWKFQEEEIAKQAIDDTFCLAQTILSHVLHDLLVILRQYEKESPIWVRILSSVHKKSLYNKLIKSYHQMSASSKEIHFYFFDIDYCTETALQLDPFLSLLPIDTEAVAEGAKSDLYPEILNFLDNPYKKIQSVFSSELANELQAVFSKERHADQDNDQNQFSNPWPYSYVPIPFDDFMKIKDKLNIRLNAITGDDEGVEALPDVIQRITKRLQNPEKVQVEIAGKHNAHLQLENSTSLNLARQHVEIEHDNFIQKFPALTLNAELGDNSDPIICMRQMIDLAIESHNPYFYIVGDEGNLELTKQFLVEALLIVKHNKEVKFRPQIIGLSPEVITKISKDACEQAGYPSQDFLSGMAE